jgi:hypothetical protein
MKIRDNIRGFPEEGMFSEKFGWCGDLQAEPDIYN